MEESWETNFPQLIDMDDAEDFPNQYYHMMMSFEEEDEEFLRNILQQPGNYLSSQNETENNSLPIVVAATNSSGNHGTNDKNHVMSPRAYILSFDDSNIIPAISKHEESSTLKRCSLKTTTVRHNIEPKKKSRSCSKTVDHIMAERRRRQQLAERFIALSATIPGLKKMDKATILNEAIKYVKQLQERVRELEKQNNKNNNGESPGISIKKFELRKNNNFYEANEVLTEIEVRVSENQVFLGIHCEKQKGIQFKILALLENFHLHVTGSSILPFGNSTLVITIIAQMGDEYRMTMNGVVKNLRQVLLKLLEN